MAISKIIGSVDMQMGNNARIKVLSFRKDGLSIKDFNEIRKDFPPDGYIFAPAYFSYFEIPLNSIVEFVFDGSRSNKSEGDQFILNHKTNLKPVGYPVFLVRDKILLLEYSINLNILNTYSDSLNFPSFYIVNDEFLYGPFKNINSEILPKTSKEVYRWSLSNVTIESSGEKKYILEPPIINDDPIDCMTTQQLGAWFKDQIRNLKIEGDLSLIPKALESLQLEGLDVERLKRVTSGIDQISTTYSELKFLASTSTQLQEIYTNLLSKVEKDARAELLEPIHEEQNQLEKELSKLKEVNIKLQKEKTSLIKEFGIIKNDYDKILLNKEKIVDDIRIQSLISNSIPIVNNKLETFEEQVYKIDGNFYTDLKEFFVEFNQSIENSDIDRNYGYNSIFQLKEKKCLLATNVTTILQLAKISNNCKVIIQQVEADWLKFESFYRNGLQNIWKSAVDNPTLIHFLILEDLNMASIECYGRPLLDIISGIRKKIPGLGLPFPLNLWIFGVPIISADNENFGLPLISETYKLWGMIEQWGGELVFKEVPSAKCLKVETIFTHDKIIPMQLDQNLFQS